MCYTNPVQTHKVTPIINGDGKPWVNAWGEPMMCLTPTKAGHMWFLLKHTEAMMDVTGIW